MPMWCPPTPPQQDNDMYIDHSMAFLYDTHSVMAETQLPLVYVKKDTIKRPRAEPCLVDIRRPVKVHKREDVAQPPKSIFNTSLALKIRRDARIQKIRGLIRPQITPIPGVKYPVNSKSQVEPPGHNWTIHEDAAILKVLQSYQGLTVNLVIACAGHTPNWDFVADYVNTVSNTYRSPKQCRNRYETVLIPREEGKQTIDTSPRKKKQKTAMSPGGTVYKVNPSKSNRSTSQLYTQDNNSTFTSLATQRFDGLKVISAKKPVVSSVMSVAVKNTKNEGYLSEHGIDLDHPMTAADIATKRAERNREKKALPDQLHIQKQLQLIRQAQAQAASAVPSSVASSPSSTQGIQQQQQQVQAVAQTVQVSTVQTVVSSVVTTPSTPPTNTARMQRIVATASPLQSQSVVSVSGQLQGQRLIVSGPAGQSKATVVGASSVSAKSIREAQLQLLRQATLKQQTQHMRLQSAGISPQALKTSTVVTIPGQSAVQVQFTQAQPRTHIIKSGTVTVGNKQVTRTLTESEVAQFLKLKSQNQKLTGQATTIANPQVFAQTLQAGPSGTQVATIVKTVSTPGVTQAVIGTPVKSLPTGIKTQATPQQIRSLQIQQIMQQKKLLQQHAASNKIAGVAQVTNKAGVPTQLLVQSAKPLTTAISMQQFQQVIRSPLTVPQGSVVLAKAPARMNLVNPGQGSKPTIQVVTSSSPGLTTTIRPSTSSTLAAAALAGIKVQNAAAGTSHAQQAILSHVSAVLGQNVRQGSPVRIQTAGGSSVAVTVQHQSTSPSLQAPAGDKPTDTVSRFVKKP